MGIAHSIDVKGEQPLFEGLLEEYAVPCEVANQCSDILARVADQLGNLEQKQIKTIIVALFYMKEPHIHLVHQILLVL